MADTIDVRIPLGDERSLPAALAHPLVPPSTGSAPAARRPAVLVLHEILGLNDDIRRIAGRFADAGYVALAPDFLAGLGPRPLCMLRFVAALGGGPRSEPFRRLDAARRWLAGRPDVDGGAIGVAGFCVGGGFAILYAADAGPGTVHVLAPFYAAVPATAQRLAGLCPTVASYGGRDRLFGTHAERLRAALEALGIEHDVHVYPEAGHAFMSRHGRLTTAIESRLPPHGGYHEASAEDAWRRTLAFFERHLHPRGETGPASGPEPGPLAASRGTGAA